MKNIQKKVIVSVAVLISIFIFNFITNNAGENAYYKEMTGAASYNELNLNIDEIITVDAFSMNFSILIIIFLVLVILKPSFKNLLLIPFLVITWALLTESYVRIFQIPVIRINPLEGNIYVVDSLFFQSNLSSIIIEFFFMVVIGIIVGAIGLALSYMVRGIFK